MFAGQHQQLGQGQLCAHKSYRLVDTWGRGADGSAHDEKGRRTRPFSLISIQICARVFFRRPKTRRTENRRPRTPPSKTK